MTADELDLQRWREALAEEPTAWDFSTLRGFHGEESPWRWRTLVENRAPMADRVLDLGTGRGEVLASLVDVLPEGTVATAADPSSVRERLAPLGIEVLEHDPDRDGPRLPVPDDSFGLVLSRHQPFDATEVARVLAPGGTFLTQQVGADDAHEIRALFGHEQTHPEVTLEETVHTVTAAGLTVDRADAFHGLLEFEDVATLLRYLRHVPWAAPEDLDVDRRREVLETLQDRLAEGPFTATVRRYLVEARTPEQVRTGRTDFSQLLDDHPEVPRV